MTVGAADPPEGARPRPRAGTTQHRTLTVTDRAGGRKTETKADIGRQHGVAEHAIQRANPKLNHREPRSGEWVLIPVRS